MKFRARISRGKKEVMLPPNDNFNTMYVYVLHIFRILSHPLSQPFEIFISFFVKICLNTQILARAFGASTISDRVPLLVDVVNNFHFYNLNTPSPPPEKNVPIL